MYLSLYSKVWKGYSRFYCERGLETEQKLQYFDPHSYGHQRCVFLVLLMLNRGPNGSLCWLSLLHLISNFSGPQLIRAPRAPSAGLLYHILSSNSSNLQLSDFLSWLSYIIVQRPLNRPLNLWNGMFDRHQAKITFMQFRGLSLPVHQSMSVSWDFFLVPFC